MGIDYLDQYDLHVRSLVINKLLRVSMSDPLFKGRLDQQQQYRKQIDAEFPEQSELDLALPGRDINTLESLQSIDRHIEDMLAPQDNVAS